MCNTDSRPYIMCISPLSSYLLLLAKDAVSVIDSFDLLLEAQEYARKYPSRAEDSGTQKRFVQHIITRVLNKMNSLMEVSDTQAAAALLGMDSGVCSDIFSAYDPSMYAESILLEKHQKKGTVYDRDVEEDLIGTDDDQSDLFSLDSFIVPDEEFEAGDDDILLSEGDEDEQDEDDSLSLASDQDIRGGVVECPYEACVPRTASYRSTPLYKVDGEERMIPIPYPDFYRYRGKDLQMLSRYEYCTQVKIEKKTKDSDQEDTCSTGGHGDVQSREGEGQRHCSAQRGRKKSKSFEFGDGCKLKASHVQRLRVKLCTLKLYSNPPPHPGSRPRKEVGTEARYIQWKKKADRYAFFFLTLFRPEGDLYDKWETNVLCYDWDTFVTFYNGLKDGNRFDQMRYRTMEGYMHGWRTTARNRAILSTYRGRKRTIWSEEEQQEARKKYGKNNSEGRTFYDEEDGGPDLSAFELTNREAMAIMKNVSYSDDLAATLNRVSDGFDDERGETSMDTTTAEDTQQGNGGTDIDFRQYRMRVTPAHHRLAERILEKSAPFDADGQQEDETEDDDEGRSVAESTTDAGSEASSKNEQDQQETNITNDDGDNEQGGALSDGQHNTQFFIDHFTNKRLDEYVTRASLSEDKMLAVSVMRNHFRSVQEGLPPDYIAPLLLVTGGPGVGKSFLVDVLDNTARIMRVGDQLRMALFGIAAVNIDGASMMSMMDIPTEFNQERQQRVHPWNGDKLVEFKKVFDMTKISAIIIDEISTVKPYMLAYLNARLQDACSSTLPFGGKALVMLGDFDQLPPAGGPSMPEVAMMIEKEKHLGGGLRYKSKKFEVTSIIRQGVELFKRAHHIRLSVQHRSEDEHHTHLLERMSGGKPIGPEDLAEYKTLSSDDHDFEFATILTPGNRERHEFNNTQARRWAKRYGTNTVRWPRRIREKTWKGKPRDPRNVARAKEESCFWELFVPSALAYLTFNLNMYKGLANGLPVKYHSISFYDREDQERFEEILQTTPPGETVTLQHPPDIINVELFPDFPGDSDKERMKNKARRDRWLDGSITEDGRVVIPITVSNKKYVKWKKSQIRGGGRSRFMPSKVDLADYFPIEPGFSITLHKAQVSFLLCFSRHNISLAERYFVRGSHT